MKFSYILIFGVVLLMLITPVAARYDSGPKYEYQKWVNSRYMPPPTSTPTPTPTPIPISTVMPMSSNVYRVHYDVMIIDDVDVSVVEKALLYIPNYYDFTIVPNDPSRYTYRNNDVTMPKSPYLIVVSSDKRAENRNKPIGYNYGNGRIGIYHQRFSNGEYVNPYDVAILLEHELAHTDHDNIDLINFMQDSGFISWRDRNNCNARLWYDYLISVMLG